MSGIQKVIKQLEQYHESDGHVGEWEYIMHFLKEEVEKLSKSKESSKDKLIKQLQGSMEGMEIVINDLQSKEPNKDSDIKIEKVKCHNHIVNRWQNDITLKQLTETENIQWQNLTFYLDN